MKKDTERIQDEPQDAAKRQPLTERERLSSHSRNLPHILDVVTSEEYNILVLHYRNGESVGNIAKMLRVHRVTLSKRIANIRARIQIEFVRRGGMDFGNLNNPATNLHRHASTL